MPESQSSNIDVTANGKISDSARELVTNGSIELSAMALDQIPAAAKLLPFGTSVYVPSVANMALFSNLKVVEALHEAGMEPVPHIAARKVKSRLELQEYLKIIVQEYGVHRIMLIGGDLRQAVGSYSDSTAVLRDEVLAEARIREVGVAGYPEGHPHIPTKILNADFDDKLKLAEQLQLGLEVVTQFSFAPTRIVEYCAALSHRAPNIPVYVGIAGPTSTAKLIRYARYCGVSASLRALTDLGVKAVKLISHTNPDKQLTTLAQYCALRQACNVIGIHIFSFGGFEQSAKWMRNKCRQDN